MLVKSYFGSGLFEENSFLIIDEQTGATAIVDPSFVDDDTIKTVARIDFILLTHGHVDHISKVLNVKEKFKAKIVCHEDEALLLANPNANLTSTFGMDLIITPDITLKDGDCLNIGNLEIKCMHTPGHTQGGACYIMEEHIFTGDTVMAGTIGRTDLPTGNYNTLMGSIAKIKKLEKNYILHCGHGGDTKLDVEKKSNMYFR